MRQFINLIVTGSIFFVLSSCTENSSKFQKYTSPDGAFSINMPANYKKFDSIKKNSIYGRLVTHYVSWKPSVFALDKFKLFQIAYTDYPADATADSILSKNIAAHKEDFTEVDVDYQAIEMQGHPGRAYIYDPPSSNEITVGKECVVKNRLYEITVMAKRNYPTNIELASFFNSFQLWRN